MRPDDARELAADHSLPARPPDDAAEKSARPDDAVAVPPGVPGARLVDTRTGLVRRLERRPVPDHFPRSFGLVNAVLADSTQVTPWAADASAAGYGFGDDTRRVAAALGEAAERTCGYLVPPGLVTATWEDLRRRGLHAVDPAALALFSAGQHARAGFPFAPLTRATAVPWAPGLDLVTRRRVLVPAPLAWVADFAAPAAGALPRTNPIVQAGLAAGPTPAFARAGGLREVIERDAMTLCWHGGRGVLRLDPPPWLARLGAGPEGMLATRWYGFPNDYGLPVVGALVADHRTGYLALGMGATTGPEPAAAKALAEALQLQLLLARYDDPAGAIAAASRLPTSPLKPWRADRAYAASYRPDLADAVDYGCHLQLHLDPAVQRRFEAELADATVDRRSLAALEPTTSGAVLRRIRERGQRAVAVDLTTADVRSAGLHVARVLVPGCYSNSAAGLPFLGGHRLARALADRARPRRALPLPH